MELEPNQVGIRRESNNNNSTTTRQTRANTRANLPQPPQLQLQQQQQHRTNPLRRTRFTAQLDQTDNSEGKSKDESQTSRPSKKPRRSTIILPTTSSLTINEPTKDSKGKKRADPDSDQDPEQPSPYSLRPRKSAASTSSTSTPTSMPKKSGRLSTSAASKGKSTSSANSTMSSAAAAKTAKAKAAAHASSASRLEDDDIDMMDVDDRSDDDDVDDAVDNDNDNGRDEDHDFDHDHDDEDHTAAAATGTGGGGATTTTATTTSGSTNDPSTNTSFDASAALSFFGDYRSVGSYLVTLSNRLKTILNNIKPTADPTTRLVALQELSELLSISTEDTLSGYFQIDSFVKELVGIMGGSRNGGSKSAGGRHRHDEDDDDDEDEDGGAAGAIGGGDDIDEDAALAAALAASAGAAGGGSAFGGGDENMEAQVLACRCLANLMEAMPGSAHTVVYHGAVPVLCSKLLEISYIDLAEQTLSTLEKISEEYPSAIVREGGLAALLNFLDFFSTTVQRTALQAASNCCRNVSPDNFTMVRDVFPILRTVLSYSDQRLVEYACLCVIRIIESYHRTSPGLLESLIDAQLIDAVRALLLPAAGGNGGVGVTGGGGSSSSSALMVSPNTYTLVLRALGTAAKASPKIAVTLLEADVVDVLYQILTGVLPPNEEYHSSGGSGGGRGQGYAEGGQGLGGGLTDMAVMETLAHRPKEQVEEALSLISELMPPLPKDGVFDSKAYTEKALNKLVKAKAKAERALHRATAVAAAASNTTSVASSAAPSKAPTPAPPEDAISMDATIGGSSGGVYHTRAYDAMVMNIDTHHPDASQSQAAKDSTSTSTAPTPMTRVELMRTKVPLVSKFARLLVPVLVDVYAASVASQVRTKALVGLLKAVSFLDGDDLRGALKFVPIASFAGSILSSRDHSTLVLAALQLVELLLIKLPSDYKPAFRREGVLYEIESIAEQKLSTANNAKSNKDNKGDSTPENTNILPPSSSRRSSSHHHHLHLAQDPQDAIILRARVIRLKYLSGSGVGSGAAVEFGAGDEEEGGAVFTKLKGLVVRISDPAAKEETLRQCLWEIAELFVVGGGGDSGSGWKGGDVTSWSSLSDPSSVSSFEVLQSGLVDGLLEFATVKERAVSIERRKQLLYEVFMDPSSGSNLKGGNGGSGDRPTPFATLIKKLQESLTRMESFEVVTVSQGIDDTKRSSAASMLAKQLRLRLIASPEDVSSSEIPRNCSNIIVSIHAIATFQALNDYLRPRVSGLLGGLGGGGGSGSSRLSGMLAALAASGIGRGGGFGRSFAASGSGLGFAQEAPSASGSHNAGAAGASSNEGTVAQQQPSATAPRRRSLRLSAKAGKASTEPQPEATTATTSTTGPGVSVSVSTSTTTSSEPGAHASEPSIAAATAESMGVSIGLLDHPRSETAVNEDDEDEDEDLQDDFGDDNYDAEVFEDDVDPDVSLAETTVTLNVADDGSKVEAQTPDGTRISTPKDHTRTAAGGGASSSTTSKPSSSSYAAALKAKPTDWHLEFSMDDHVLPLDMTIYGAVYQHESRKNAGTGTTATGGQSSSSSSSLNFNSLWNGVYTIKFRKVPGLPPLPDGDNFPKDRSASPQLSSVPSDAPHSKILKLMRVLYKLNERGDRRAKHALSDSAFINNKLTAKLTRQLEEPMIVASSCLPDWALELSQHFPFLFPFSTRYSFLQSTSFGYARLILKWQSQQNRTSDSSSSSRRDDAFGFLGRLQRQKVRVSRKHILESAVKVFELYGSSSSVLEVEYFEEVGTGLGPTLEFYSLVSKEFARRDLKIWRDADSTVPGVYVYHPQGLFPAPLSHDAGHEREQKRMHLYQVIGQFIGKALLDSRIIDMSFNKIFMKLVLEENVPQTIDTLRVVDPDLANSLTKLQSYVDTVRVMDSPVSYSPDPKKQFLSPSRSVRLDIEDLALDFTLPGYDIELKPGGRDISVTSDNVDEYIAAVIDAIVGKGVAAQVKAFRDGFSKVFPVDDLKIFSADELIMMFGNAEEDWSIDTLNEALKADHGFNVESRAIRDLVELMASFDQNVRRDYLQFITGSPKLPIGGFRGLNPPLTVVRKPHEAPLSADDYLPSVMTCVNYLKLPEYSTKDVMASKLAIAMKEGVGSFHLS